MTGRGEQKKTRWDIPCGKEDGGATPRGRSEGGEEEFGYGLWVLDEVVYIWCSCLKGEIAGIRDQEEMKPEGKRTKGEGVER
ncbi:hypothetical protein ACH5RR_003704 [Cinchona calisaya]|uniref:Uncharacterized protein n=1 Tax=Cinchona calisaya TaxID=153742 RepID=A0ABD3AVS7_9GENT